MVGRMAKEIQQVFSGRVIQCPRPAPVRAQRGAITSVVFPAPLLSAPAVSKFFPETILTPLCESGYFADVKNAPKPSSSTDSNSQCTADIHHLDQDSEDIGRPPHELWRRFSL